MWYYKGQVVNSIEDFPEGALGFIYKITRLDDGKFYVGRKNLYSERNVKLGKRELEAQALIKKPGKKPTKKKVIKESDWMAYYGSDANLKADLKEKGHAAYKREIIQICFNKKQITYQELRHQILQGCLESDNCWNDNILGKFFKKDLLNS